jgi:hypothetical protein
MASLAAFKPVAIRSVRASRASAVVPVAAFPTKYVSRMRARGAKMRRRFCFFSFSSFSFFFFFFFFFFSLSL